MPASEGVFESCVSVSVSVSESVSRFVLQCIQARVNIDEETCVHLYTYIVTSDYITTLTRELVITLLSAGYYWETDYKRASECPKNHFCKGQKYDEYTKCPAQTSTDNKKGQTECVIDKGIRRGYVCVWV